VTGHVPLRPSWQCAECSRPWPCEIRREQLADEFEPFPVTLVLLMAAWFVDAAEDLAGEPVGELYDRFVGWARVWHRQVRGRGG
jgi:hypothetical protein